MTVLEVMRKYKQKRITDCWVQEENGYEFLYGLYGYSSIENKKYIDDNEKVLNSKVIHVSEINDHIIRIIYQVA